MHRCATASRAGVREQIGTYSVRKALPLGIIKLNHLEQQCKLLKNEVTMQGIATVSGKHELVC